MRAFLLGILTASTILGTAIGLGQPESGARCFEDEFEWLDQCYALDDWGLTFEALEGR